LRWHPGRNPLPPSGTMKDALDATIDPSPSIQEAG
jgi:hypothetical protein